MKIIFGKEFLRKYSLPDRDKFLFYFNEICYVVLATTPTEIFVIADLVYQAFCFLLRVFLRNKIIFR